MINKQIIIDGCNVSGCCQYMPRYMEDYDIDTLDYCGYHFKPCKDVDVKYCYYKQLKRSEAQCEAMFVSHTDLEKKYKAKEQECERLSKGYAELTDIVSPYMDDFTGYNEEFGGFDLILCIKELLQQLDQLKAENDELKFQNKRLDEVATHWHKSIFKVERNERKLKQTLTEIKEIAQYDVYTPHTDLCIKLNWVKKKISEVENEE